MFRRDDAWAQLDVADQAHNTQAELGWVLDPAHTGHGYATEAVRELLRYCFQDLGVRRVTADCFLHNDTSWRLMERVGMRREHHAVRESLHRSGRWLDTVGYAVLKEEWSTTITAHGSTQVSPCNSRLPRSSPERGDERAEALLMHRRRSARLQAGPAIGDGQDSSWLQ
jgi:Acetyltransferase (GNAT) domain